jgi:hypothetical protein
MHCSSQALPLAKPNDKPDVVMHNFYLTYMDAIHPHDEP